MLLLLFFLTHGFVFVEITFPNRFKKSNAFGFKSVPDQ
jgi:hypothetical protein